MAPLRNSDFWASADLADELDVRKLEQRPDLILEVVPVDLVDLGRDLERQAAALRDAHRAVDALLRRDPPEEGKVGRLARLRRQQVPRQAVMDRADPVRLMDRPPLRVRDRHHRHRRERLEHRLMLGQVEPSMQRGDERHVLPRHQRERVVVEVRVDDVELRSPAGRRVRSSPCAARWDRAPIRPDAGPSATSLPASPRSSNRRWRTASRRDPWPRVPRSARRSPVPSRHRASAALLR